MQTIYKLWYSSCLICSHHNLISSIISYVSTMLRLLFIPHLLMTSLPVWACTNSHHWSGYSPTTCWAICITYICTQTLVLSHSTQVYTYVPDIYVPGLAHLFPRSFTYSSQDHLTLIWLSYFPIVLEFPHQLLHSSWGLDFSSQWVLKIMPHWHFHIVMLLLPICWHHTHQPLNCTNSTIWPHTQPISLVCQNL